MSNREIIEELRKQIEDILRQYDTPGLTNHDKQPGASEGVSSRGCSAYPDIKPQVARKKGFTIHTTVYSAGANEWLHPTPLEIILPLLCYEDSGLASDGEVIFLDIETTGLSGAGTVAFLTGLGKWTDDGFEIAQFFLEDRNSEPDMLKAIGTQIAGAQVLVTFNGKSFDLPVLQTRFIMNGMPDLAPEIENKTHLDLYSVARKLGRHPFYGMSLKDCAERFPGIRRFDDIPGRMIPALYFMYERDHDISVLSQVFSHNRLDILDMVVLLKYAEHLFTKGYEFCHDPSALAGIGKFYMAHGDMEIAGRFLQAAVNDVLPAQSETTAANSRLLATVLRKQGEWDKAASIWSSLINSRYARYEDYLWLARYYELRLNDIDTSFRIVLDCIEHCRQSGISIPEPVSSRKRRLARIISGLHS